MADIYSSLATDLQTEGKLVDSRNLSGKARVFPFSFLFSSAGAAPVLYMTKIPAGTKMVHLYIETDGLSASAGVALTIDIGDSGDADRFKAAYDADVANAAHGMRKGTNLGFMYEYTTDTWITGTVAASKTPADTKSLWGYFIGVTSN